MQANRIDELFSFWCYNSDFGVKNMYAITVINIIVFMGMFAALK